MANIAIFGGTFNPFHIGHYEILNSVCNLQFIDKVLVMPDKIPPHKSFEHTVDDIHRQNMCAIACNDFNKANLCLLEFERTGKSYTFDTLSLLKKQYPNDSFFVVIGGDMLATLDTWYNWQELIKSTNFIAFNRSGEDAAQVNIVYKKLLGLGANITILTDNITNVSSTIIRNKINKNLLPVKIYNYIIEKGLYNA